MKLFPLCWGQLFDVKRDFLSFDSVLNNKNKTAAHLSHHALTL